MAQVKVAISPNIYEWILQTAPLEGIDDKKISQFHKWKNNEKQPTFNQIEDFSKKTRIPLGYFFLQTPPVEQLPLLNYRTIKSTAKTNPSRELIDIYYHMTAIQDWMRDYLLDSGNDKLSFVGSCKNEKKVENITKSIRKTINLNMDWFTKTRDQSDSFNFLRQCFENAGILIMKNGVVGQNSHRPLDIYEFRAFTLLDEFAPLVFINNKDSTSGQLFSLLHEIAHIWLGLHSFYNDSYGMTFNISPLETICNAVAAELLVPQQIFINKWDDTNLSVEENTEKLAKFFKCGKTIIIRKALDNKFITNEQYQVFANDIIAGFWQRKTKNKKNEGDYYKTIMSRYSPRFILALANSFQEGKTFFKVVHKLTGTKREIFNKFVNEVRERYNGQ
ncbi:MAG: ImmA/IrrE family metallo-endopeptidase [Bacteroidetes bacterium]|nr:ImmA/IrrE family metallo-endopeptidase [Bacteroidota bacterium]